MRTSLYSVLCIVIRLGAILLAMNTAIGFAPAYLAASNGHFGVGATGSVIGFSGALLATAVLLWLFPGILARLAVGQASQQVFELTIGANELQYIALAVLGVAFAMSGLIDLVDFSMRTALTFNLNDSTYIQRENWLRVVPQILKLVLGLVLAVGSRGLAGLLHRLRETGLGPASSEHAQNVDSVDAE